MTIQEQVVRTALDGFRNVLLRFGAAVSAAPTGLDRAAAELRAGADTLDGIEDRVSRARPHEAWTGPAAQTYVSGVATAAQQLATVASLGRGHVGALAVLSRQLRTHQDQMSHILHRFDTGARIFAALAGRTAGDAGKLMVSVERFGMTEIRAATAVRDDFDAALYDFARSVILLTRLAGNRVTAVPVRPPTTGGAAAAPPASGAPPGAVAPGSPLASARVPQRLRQWIPYAHQAALDHGIDPYLVLAVIDRETGGRNILGDGGHGHGLMQIDDRYHAFWLRAHANGLDPRSNIDYGASILRQNIDMFPGNLRAAVAAYNAGPDAVQRALRAGRDPDSPTTHANYSSDVLARAALMRPPGGG